jgi:hypothetical protein
MLKKALLILLISFSAVTVYAQTAEEVYNKYLDFNLERLQGETDKALTLGRILSPMPISLRPMHATIFIML